MRPGTHPTVGQSWRGQQRKEAGEMRVGKNEVLGCRARKGVVLLLSDKEDQEVQTKKWALKTGSWNLPTPSGRQPR